MSLQGVRVVGGVVMLGLLGVARGWLGVGGWACSDCSGLLGVGSGFGGVMLGLLGVARGLLGLWGGGTPPVWRRDSGP